MAFPIASDFLGRTRDTWLEVSDILVRPLKYEEKMRCRQLNLNHCEAAQSLLRQAVIDGRTQVVLILEPYRNIPGNGWLASSCKGAAL